MSISSRNSANHHVKTKWVPYTPNCDTDCASVCERERKRQKERGGGGGEREKRERKLMVYRKSVTFFPTYFVSCNGPCALQEKRHIKEHIIIIIITIIIIIIIIL